MCSTAGLMLWHSTRRARSSAASSTTWANRVRPKPRRRQAGSHAETEIDLAVTGGDVRERHDPSARVGQAVDVVAREVDAGDVAGDPLVTDAVAEAEEAIIDIERHEVGEDALGIRRREPEQRAGRAVPLAIIRSEGTGRDWTGDDGHGGDPGQAGGISGGRVPASPAPRRAQGPAGSICETSK